mgnify:CR=1 FL=1
MLTHARQSLKTSSCTSKLHMFWWTSAYRDWHRGWHLNWGWYLLDRLHTTQQHKQCHINCTCALKPPKKAAGHAHMGSMLDGGRWLQWTMGQEHALAAGRG